MSASLRPRPRFPQSTGHHLFVVVGSTDAGTFIFRTAGLSITEAVRDWLLTRFTLYAPPEVSKV